MPMYNRTHDHSLFRSLMAMRRERSLQSLGSFPKANLQAECGECRVRAQGHANVCSYKANYN